MTNNTMDSALTLKLLSLMTRIEISPCSTGLCRVKHDITAQGRNDCIGLFFIKASL